MGDRLLRALQRGGCVHLQGSRWKVHRCRDRRSRSIGTMSAAQICDLRQQGRLIEATSGAGSDMLVWNDACAAPHRPAGQSGNPMRRAPALDAVGAALSGVEPAGHGALLRAAAQRFASDAQFGLGDDRRQGPGADAARARFRRFQDQMPKAQRRALLVALVHENSLEAIAQAAGWPADAAAQNLTDALRALADLYGLIRPDRDAPHLPGCDQASRPAHSNAALSGHR